MFQKAVSLFAAIGIVASVSAHPGHHFNLKSSKPFTLFSVGGVVSPGAVSADKKTLTFSRRKISLVVTTGPSNDMLSYRIQGLRNPKLVIPAGAKLRVLFVNSDDDMVHNFKFADDLPPFAPKPTLKNAAGSHDLAHRTEKSMHAEELLIAGPTEKGNFSYVCTTSGHAAAGMFGLVVVR